jgi:molecular chaperone HscC
MDQPIIGIDLGTTQSAAAWMSPEGIRLIPNALGELLTPSVVGIDLSGKLVVGAPAVELRVVRPERCASQFKRSMGTEKQYDLAGQKFTSEQLSSLCSSR